MAKVATQSQGPMSSSALQFGTVPSKVRAAVKRKTPSELRGEQLKRTSVMEVVGESPTNDIDFHKTKTAIKCGFQNPDSSKSPRYVDTRMDALYPVRKNSSRLRLLARKEDVKGPSVAEHNGILKNCSVSSDSTAKTITQISRDSLASSSVTESVMVRASKTAEKIGDNKFLSVNELASGGENLPGEKTVDMDKALKGLIHEAPRFSGLAPETTGKISDFTAGNLCSEFQIQGRKSPLDFTLKTSMRVVSSSSVNWFHRLVSCGSYGGLPHFFGTSQVPSSGGQKDSPVGLHSWVYPQSSLPPSVVSTLSLSVAGGVPMDFLNSRQSAWEDAFRNLYYMLRKRICDMFYVCTAQFVVMFVGDGTKENKHQCHAYMSQSTRTLRSLLREHDIHYSMPLCQSKVEQITTEDLVELSEMENNNLGQIRRQASMSDVDNSSQSLLAFSGNENIHGLYDFLLNHRFLITSLSGVDVPVLYSPVPFQNASLSSPEVRCREVNTVDSVSFSGNDSNMKDEHKQGSSAGSYNSIEIKDSYLPPWVISNVCEAMHSKGMSFEASFVTESTSTGLNVVLDLFNTKLNTEATSAEEPLGKNSSFIPNTIFSPHLHSAYLKGLNYTNGSYIATTSPL